MSHSNSDSPKSFSKDKSGQNQVSVFKAQSRFGGFGRQPLVKGSQFKPAPVKITQHKG
ncbi:hypothetical protein KBA63_05630 [Candidatus Woesebacteria bacterium]|jgi:hypothetical protein|nr:hypothetical protein [Candidatus Woesebacteria bacterium]MBP9687603.1 hypothetical protein [Candidatus Woesebacteria bacterium]